jgi:hypothetical protein
VLAGHFYFTSLAPGDYSFPYPILLYVFAAPFSFLAPDTIDRVALLRIIVTAADATAGAMLYWMLVRTTTDRLVGVASVVWYHLVPMTAWIMTWGNLTNAFGQALFVMSLATVVAVPVEWTKPLTVALLAALASAALLAHPSTCAILTMLLVLTAFLYRWRGGHLLQDAARGVCVAALVAAVVAFVLYYAWFSAIYNSELSRAASEAATRAVQPSKTFLSKLASVPDLAVASFGWPALVAASAGTWRLSRGAEPLRLTLPSRPGGNVSVLSGRRPADANHAPVSFRSVSCSGAGGGVRMELGLARLLGAPDRRDDRAERRHMDRRPAVDRDAGVTSPHVRCIPSLVF